MSMPSSFSSIHCELVFFFYYLWAKVLRTPNERSEHQIKGCSDKTDLRYSLSYRTETRINVLPCLASPRLASFRADIARQWTMLAKCTLVGLSVASMLRARLVVVCWPRSTESVHPLWGAAGANVSSNVYSNSWLWVGRKSEWPESDNEPNLVEESVKRDGHFAFLSSRVFGKR